VRTLYLTCKPPQGRCNGLGTFNVHRDAEMEDDDGDARM